MALYLTQSESFIHTHTRDTSMNDIRSDPIARSRTTAKKTLEDDEDDVDDAIGFRVDDVDRRVDDDW